MMSGREAGIGRMKSYLNKSRTNEVSPTYIRLLPRAATRLFAQSFAADGPKERSSHVTCSSRLVLWSVVCSTGAAIHRTSHTRPFALLGALRLWTDVVPGLQNAHEAGVNGVGDNFITGRNIDDIMMQYSILLTSMLAYRLFRCHLMH
jgi:hypothetical protein